MNNLSFQDLSNKNCVITGGSGVLGSAIVDALLSANLNVASLSRSGKEPTDLLLSKAAEKNIKLISVKGNVIDKNSLIEAKAKINDELGKIDFLINCAGGNFPGATAKLEEISAGENNLSDSFFGLDIEEIRKVTDLNYTGTLLPTLVFSKDMINKKEGSIINISSVASILPLTRVIGYSGAKAAINNFTKWLAVHFAKTNVRANAIVPGFFLSEQNKFLLTDEETGELTARGKKIINSTPMGRFGDPNDLRGAALFLLSDLSKFITGIILPVDGGFTAYSGV